MKSTKLKFRYFIAWFAFMVMWAFIDAPVGKFVSEPIIALTEVEATGSSTVAAFGMGISLVLYLAVSFGSFAVCVNMFIVQGLLSRTDGEGEAQQEVPAD